MRFKGLDLNLIVAFNVLLEERSVVRASEKLGLSQPATSSALARLRDYFEDEILVAQGRRMFATAFAETLWPYVRECLQVAEHLTKASVRFNPATSRRKFRIVASDYILASMFASLCETVAKQAPYIEFDFRAPDQDTLRKLDVGEIDLFITPEDYTSADQHAELLLEEQHVIAGCVRNSIFSEPVTEAAVFARGHVAVVMGSSRTPSFGDRYLERLEKPRRIEVTVSTFTMVPWMLMGTERVAVMHERLADAMASHFPIRFEPLPFDFPIMREMLQFHRTRATDEGLLWLIEQIKVLQAQMLRTEAGALTASGCS